MYYIYKFTNKINGKTYIGQTNDIIKRKRGHKSDSFNIKSTGYYLPFHAAIRKYGWDNFDFEILEEVEDTRERKLLNEREIFWINKYHSLTSENGYNITIGGDGCSKPSLSFEERCQLSKRFSIFEIKDIQNMLCEDYEYFEIIEKYPQLNTSFLSNINIGLNFKREDLEYPLKKFHSSFNLETKMKIIDEIKANVPYSKISEKYNISSALLSMINNGKSWHNKNLKYPLSIRENYNWVEDCKKEIIFSDKTLKQIANDFNISYSTIKLLVSGKHHYDDKLIYPLRKNKKLNQKIYKELFNIVSTIPGETGSTIAIDTQQETV